MSTSEYQLKCPICPYETPLRKDYNFTYEKLDDLKFQILVAQRMFWHLNKEHGDDTDELFRQIIYGLVEIKSLRDGA